MTDKHTITVDRVLWERLAHASGMPADRPDLIASRSQQAFCDVARLRERAKGEVAQVVRVICATAAVLFIAAAAVGIARAGADCPERPVDALRGNPGWEIVLWVPGDARGGIPEYARMLATDVETGVYETADFRVTYRPGSAP
jgi:hypothetical protein